MKLVFVLLTTVFAYQSSNPYNVAKFSSAACSIGYGPQSIPPGWNTIVGREPACTACIRRKVVCSQCYGGKPINNYWTPISSQCPKFP